jgi:glutamate 5-kinase
VDAVKGVPGTGTVFVPRPHRLPARKLWIAFAQTPEGHVVVDDGARRALIERNVSLLAAGITGVRGEFNTGAAVEIEGTDGVVFAKGLVRHEAGAIRAIAGKRTVDLPAGVPHEVIHRDDLVMLP